MLSSSQYKLGCAQTCSRGAEPTLLLRLSFSLACLGCFFGLVVLDELSVRNFNDASEVFYKYLYGTGEPFSFCVVVFGSVDI